MVEDIEYLKEELKKQVSEHRYMHSLGVMRMCEKLANMYGADVKKSKLIGLMHDIAKDISREEILKYIKENNIEVTKTEMELVDTLHGKVGAHICKHKYSFDEEMSTAISVHSTGKADMTLLQKILYVADKTDETRTYEKAKELRQIAYEDLDKAIITHINYILERMIVENKPFSEESVITRNYILLHN